MKKIILSTLISACILMAGLSIPVAFLCMSLDRHSSAIEKAIVGVEDMKVEIALFNDKIESIEEDIANVDRVITGVADLSRGIDRLTGVVEKIPGEVKKATGWGSIFNGD